jgi:ABC-type multidrug transport system ATPase subunit
VTPLLEILDARLDVGGAPVVEGLGLRTSGARVLVLGAGRALFDAVCGLVTPARGEVRVHGHPAAAALREGLLAGAPLDPAMPPAWTPRAYATWSARVAGRDKATAEALAADAIARLKMESFADASLRKTPDALGVVARRATAVAAAMATGAATIVLEDPTSGLPDASARTFGKLLVAALDGRAWLVFAPHAVLASPLALAADEAIVLTGSRVAAQGDPAEIAARDRSYALTVHGPVEELARAAEARGARVRRSEAKLTVDLAEGMSTRDLLQIAIDVRAVIVELAPISRALG